MKYYLAARFSAQAEMRGVRDVLTAMGHEVTSTWLDETTAETGPDGITPDVMNADPDQCWRYAYQDGCDLMRADTVAVFTTVGPSTTGGRHVELGIALGANKHVILIGPRENIFQTLPGIDHYPDWPQWAAALATEAAEAYLRAGGGVA